MFFSRKKKGSNALLRQLEHKQEPRPFLILKSFGMDQGHEPTTKDGL